MAKNSKTPTSSAKKPKTRALRRRTRMIALEPRMLFDGALGIDLGAKGPAALFGDTSVLGYQDLLKNVNPDAKVVLLAPSRDALDQMADYMDGQSNVTAV